MLSLSFSLSLSLWRSPKCRGRSRLGRGGRKGGSGGGGRCIYSPSLAVWSVWMHVCMSSPSLAFSGSPSLSLSSGLFVTHGQQAATREGTRRAVVASPGTGARELGWRGAKERRGCEPEVCGTPFFAWVRTSRGGGAGGAALPGVCTNCNQLQERREGQEDLKKWKRMGEGHSIGLNRLQTESPGKDSQDQEWPIIILCLLLLFTSTCIINVTS